MVKKEYPAKPIMVSPSHPGVLFADPLSEIDGGRRSRAEIAKLLGV